MASNVAPVITAPLEDLQVLENAPTTPIDLFGRFDDPFTTGLVAQFVLEDSALSNNVIEVLLFDQAGAGAPNTVANFATYAQDGDYANSIIHRSVPGFVIQGGGFIVDGPAGEAITPDAVTPVPTDPPIANEFSPERSNTRGTIAMAKLGGDPDSATSQWFFNLADNSENLDNQNGGFTAFGEVLDADSLALVDEIAAISTFLGQLAPNFPTAIDSAPLVPVEQGSTNVTFVRFESISVGVSQDDELSFEVASSNPNLVTASVDESGQLELDYQPGQSGTADISVSATDLLGDTVEDTFSVTVAAIAPVFDGEIGDRTVTQGEEVAFDVSGDFSSADPDAVLTFSATGLPAGLAIGEDGTISGTPTDDDVGSFEVAVTATDAAGATAEGTFTLEVENVNDPPVAANDTATVEAANSVTVDVLANDSDPDGDALTLAIATPPSTGTATVSNGAIAYAAAADFTGSDSFVYEVDDGNGGTATATVEVTVTPPPVDNPPVLDPVAPVTLPEDTAGGTVFSNLSATDDRTPAADLTFAIAGGNADGFFAISPAGALRLTDAGAAGIDFETQAVYELQAIANDGTQDSQPFTVRVELSNVNEAPVATDDTAAVETGDTVTVDVLANDSDPDGDTLNLAIATAPSTGTATVSNGAIAYTPAADFAGSDSFTYEIDDGNGETATATVAVTVAPPPVDAPPVVDPVAPVSLPENFPGGTVFLNLSATDGETPAADLTFAIAGGNADGVFAVSPAGALRLTDAGANAFDFETQSVYELQVVANDGTQTSEPVTVRVELVDINDTPPVLSAFDPATVSSAAPAGTEIATATATDADSIGSLTYTIASGNEARLFAIAPVTGVVTLTAAGAAAPFGTNVALGIEVSDGVNTSELQELAVAIQPAAPNELVPAFGTRGDDVFDAADPRDAFSGSDELVFGGAGNDLIDNAGGGGNNRLYGGSGTNELLAGTRDRLFGGPEADILDASLGGGDNRLYGLAGDDVLIGGSGDALNGGDGDDQLIAAGLDSTMVGGSGADRFEVAAAADATEVAGTLVADFEIGTDTIGIGGGVEFADLRFEASGEDVALFLGTETTPRALLRGIAPDALGVGDFAFSA